MRSSCINGAWIIGLQPYHFHFRLNSQSSKIILKLSWKCLKMNYWHAFQQPRVISLGIPFWLRSWEQQSLHWQRQKLSKIINTKKHWAMVIAVVAAMQKSLSDPKQSCFFFKDQTFYSQTLNLGENLVLFPVIIKTVIYRDFCYNMHKITCMRP